MNSERIYAGIRASNFYFKNNQSLSDCSVEISSMRESSGHCYQSLNYYYININSRLSTRYYA